MKLAYCTKCSDVFKITYKLRRCQCKQSYAYAVDDLKSKCETAHVSEHILPIAMDNNYLMLAKLMWDRDTRTSFIHAWTIDTSNPINDCKVIVKGQSLPEVDNEIKEFIKEARNADHRTNSTSGRNEGRSKPKVMGNNRTHAN